jgi:pantetheine-phosphate adenylyltransferase
MTDGRLKVILLCHPSSQPTCVTIVNTQSETEQEGESCPVTRRAIYPGTFDPVTNGHLDIIERACRLFDEVIVAILINPGKNPMFALDERIAILNEVLNSHFPQVRVDTFDGLLVDYAARHQAHAVVRGIRAISDYEYELQMALMNRRLNPSVETVFMMSHEDYSYVSSRLIKEVFILGGSVDGLVPELVIERMRAKLGRS